MVSTNRPKTKAAGLTRKQHIMNTSLLARMAGGLLAVLLVCGLGVSAKGQNIQPIDRVAGSQASQQFNDLYFGVQPTFFYNADGSMNNTTRGVAPTKVYVHWRGLETLSSDVQSAAEGDEEDNFFSEVEILVIDMPAADRKLPVGIGSSFPKLRFLVFSSNKDLGGITLDQGSVQYMLADDGLSQTQSVTVLYENVVTGQ